MISLDNLKTVLNAIKCFLNGYAKKKDIPTKLSNPNPLTFTGAATGSYDGSQPLTIEIPSGGGGGSVPKPLTYDYMPEGYPTKGGQNRTLLEEQELAFALMNNGNYSTIIPNPLDIVTGKIYKVKWDETEYECVGAVFDSMPILGNLSIQGAGDDTGEPFIYVYDQKARTSGFITHDPSATHTVSVTELETITPMSAEFIPTMNVSAFTNDAGYLTLATLPKYEGVVV